MLLWLFPCSMLLHSSSFRKVCIGARMRVLTLKFFHIVTSDLGSLLFYINFIGPKTTLPIKQIHSVSAQSRRWSPYVVVLREGLCSQLESFPRTWSFWDGLGAWQAVDGELLGMDPVGITPIILDQGLRT